MQGSLALTLGRCSGCIAAVKWFPVLLLMVMCQSSCTTTVTRRDLYSPEPGPESYERSRELAGAVTTTTTTTTTTTQQTEGPAAAPVAPPIFR